MGKPVDHERGETMRLGSYDIVRKLARGGMAELFLSRTVGPEGIEQLVVLKKILPSHAENPKFVRLFLDEAKLAATLEHPHIARVYDMGKVDAHYFFTMEYVHGQDVRTTMRQTARAERQMPIDHAVQIARDVAAALHYAHERRRPDGTLLDIVHRDVSPSNILVSYDGEVKLVDFGVAKAATSTVKTRTGALKGKIAYMSPEQAKGAPIDRRSDIFSLGIVLWEMVTSQRLFKAENDLATIQMIINSKAQPPAQLRRECTPELERIISRALAIDVDERYQTAEQLQLDLEQHLRGSSTIALRAYMQELFADEIRAWADAQASGQTLTQHIIEKATQLTTPISESDVYAFDDDDGADDDDHPSETGAPTVPTTDEATALAPVPVPAPPRTRSRDFPLLPPSELPTMQLPSAAQVLGAMPPAMPPEPLHAAPTPFPIAPPEWRPSQDPSTLGLDANDRTKRILIGASIVFALIVLAVAVLARDPEPAAPSSAPAKIQMKAMPTTDAR